MNICPCLIFKGIDCTEFGTLFFADFCFGHGVTLNSGATVDVNFQRFCAQKYKIKKAFPLANKEHGILTVFCIYAL